MTALALWFPAPPGAESYWPHTEWPVNTLKQKIPEYHLGDPSRANRTVPDPVRMADAYWRVIAELQQIVHTAKLGAKAF